MSENDKSSALAGIARHQDEKAKDDHTRVAEHPSGEHGDLPRPATSTSERFSPEKIAAQVEAHITERIRTGQTPSQSDMAWMRSWPSLVESGEPHPWYGPCDGMGPNGECSECGKANFTSGDLWVEWLRSVPDDDDGEMFADFEPEFTVWIVRRGSQRPMVIDSIFAVKELAEQRAALLGDGWAAGSYAHVKVRSDKEAAAGRLPSSVSEKVSREQGEK